MSRNLNEEVRRKTKKSLETSEGVFILTSVRGSQERPGHRHEGGISVIREYIQRHRTEIEGTCSRIERGKRERKRIKKKQQ